MKKAVKGLVQSYQNQFNSSRIFLSSSQIAVYWAHVSVIDAEMICFNDLLAFSDWKYVVTVAGTELPNHSHKMLRAELEVIKEHDVLVSLPMPYRHYERFNQSHKLIRYSAVVSCCQLLNFFLQDWS